ncbi:oligopeptide/dipeptide ABC transporter ATP-binding protein [Nocardia sp. CA-119907]|uniref:oligopeptide/dipeptide ABC transporter ATP-binding protein n=1 Tax=Nocardia sp. CA-119907 TaxID=3239973 RepID=UPI003D987652
MVESLLEVRNLVVQYRRGADRLLAVDDVSFSLDKGETLAIIGESGSGKSSLAHALAGLVKPTAGTIHRDSSGGRRAGGSSHVIFQDPRSALNTRLSVWQCVAEVMAPERLRIPRSLRPAAVELLRRVGLGDDLADRRPAQLSGGQRQRVTIARAIASRADLILCDEPVASLDMSLQSDVLRLLAELRNEHRLTYLFISHDLSSVAKIADRVGVMYMGQLVEIGSTAAILESPAHPYTQALLAAVPRLTLARRDRRRVLLQGEISERGKPPSGCRFRTRCPLASEHCAAVAPVLMSDAGDDHSTACHFRDRAIDAWQAGSL